MNLPLRVVAVLGLWLSGCVSSGMARTVNKGQLQVSVVPGVHAIPSNSGARNDFAPHAELGVRYGVTNRLDVGARLFAPGAAVDVRLGLVRAPTLNRGIDLTLAPSLAVAVRGRSDDMYGLAELPLLLGLNTGGRLQVIIGPRAGLQFGVDPSGFGASQQVLVGSSLGLALPVGERVYIVPEVILRTPVSGFQPLVQGNLGLLLGGYRDN